MKKIYTFVAGVLSLGIVAGGVVAVSADTNQTERPSWVSAEGKIDVTKMPDDAQLPYECWNGKTVMLDGKTFKQKENNNAMPGSAEHKLGVAKSKELAAIPGVFTNGSNGGEVYNIDDNNPAVVKVMKKYEAKETPQCQ